MTGLLTQWVGLMGKSIWLKLTWTDSIQWVRSMQNGQEPNICPSRLNEFCKCNLYSAWLVKMSYDVCGATQHILDQLMSTRTHLALHTSTCEMFLYNCIQGAAQRQSVLWFHGVPSIPFNSLPTILQQWPYVYHLTLFETWHFSRHFMTTV